MGEGCSSAKNKKKERENGSRTKGKLWLLFFQCWLNELQTNFRSSSLWGTLGVCGSAEPNDLSQAGDTPGRNAVAFLPLSIFEIRCNYSRHQEHRRKSFRMFVSASEGHSLSGAHGQQRTMDAPPNEFKVLLSCQPVTLLRTNHSLYNSPQASLSFVFVFNKMGRWVSPF